MKGYKKAFDFLGFSVEVWLVNSVPNGHRAEALAGVEPHEPNSPIVQIWFKGLVNPTMVVHECWHLYMEMLSAMDNKAHWFDELNSEIYAYSFHSLFDKVLENVTGMKEYHRLWDEKDKIKEKENDN